MKPLKPAFLMSLMIIMVLAAGCAQVSTPSIEASTQVVNTDVPTATIIPSHTSTPLPTSTPPPIPTLPVEQAKARFLGLLSDNGNCRLPCLWGITPGESIYQDMRSVLMPISSLSVRTYIFPGPGGIDPRYKEDNLEILINLRFSYTDNDIVGRFYFEARGFGADDNLVYDSMLFGERLRPYMLPAVLSDHGIPTAVMVSTDGEQNDRGKNVPGFYVVLLYPDQGIMAIYTTSRQLVGGNVRGCLANAHVQIYISPTGQPEAFTEMLAQTHQWGFLWPDSQDSPYWKHIETATSLTLEEFYETFRQPIDKCLETPLSIWPIPDN